MANKILQSSKENVVSAIASITMVRDSLKEKREEYTDEKINDMIKKKKKHGKTITSNFSSS